LLERHKTDLKDVERMGQRLQELVNDRDAPMLFVDSQRKDVEEKQEHPKKMLIFTHLNDVRCRDLGHARSRR
jgi:hypothetical protein